MCCKSAEGGLLGLALHETGATSPVQGKSGEGGLIGLALHETGAASAVQRATFRSRDHHFVRSSLSSICAQLA